MADFKDFIAALEQMEDTAGAVSNSASNLSRNVEGGGAVMTDVGPANARAYSAILAGGGGPGRAPLPPDIANLSDDELRALVNQLAGTKAGRKGAAGKGMARDVLLQLAASAMGFAPPEAEPQSRGWSKILGGAPPPPSPGYSSTIAPPPPPGSPPPPPTPPEPPVPPDDEGPRSLKEAILRLTEAVKEAKHQQDRTVAQEVRGMSWAERRERLERAGKLLGEEEVQESAQKETVTKRDVIRESERKEQRERDAKQTGGRTQVEKAQQSVLQYVERGVGGMVGRILGPTIGTAVGGMARKALDPILASIVSKYAGWSAGGATAGGLAGAAGRLGGLAAGLATGPVGIAAAATAASIALLKLPGATDRLAKSFLDSQRSLAQYSASMQALFARMDYQQRVLSAQQARATGGTTSLLGAEWMKLREESQWGREAWASAKNLFGVGFVELGRMVNLMIKLSPTIQAISRVLGVIEGALERPAPADVLDYLGGFGAQYKRDRPRNRRPGEGD